MSNDASTEKKARATHALIFELEYVATEARTVQYEAIKGAIAGKGVELTPILFARSGMSPLNRAAITDVLERAGKKTDAIEKAVAEVDKAMVEFYVNAATLDKGLENMIKATQARSIPVLAFTTLPKDLARKLMNRLGLDEMGVELVIPEEVKESFPRADDWLKMLKQCNKENVTLVALVSSQVACKGALTAGAACVVIPDQFTQCQDFGGAMLVLDALADEKPDAILDMTLRM